MNREQVNGLTQITVQAGDSTPILFQRDPMRRAAEVTISAERKEAPLT
jgi:hypothetical protein